MLGYTATLKSCNAGCTLCWRAVSQCGKEIKPWQITCAAILVGAASGIVVAHWLAKIMH